MVLGVVLRDVFVCRDAAWFRGTFHVRSQVVVSLEGLVPWECFTIPFTDQFVCTHLSVNTQKALVCTRCNSSYIGLLDRVSGIVFRSDLDLHSDDLVSSEDTG